VLCDEGGPGVGPEESWVEASGSGADSRVVTARRWTAGPGVGSPQHFGNRQEWGLVMAENRTATKRRRARRPTEAAARLNRLRQRNADQLEAQREAERRVESALQAYVDADISIITVEQACDEKVSGLERQIELARTAAQEEIEQIRARQAMAVWQINDAGRTVEQISELLELPEKETRRLLRVGRATADTDTGDRNHDGAPAVQQPQPSEQRGLSGIDAEQDGPDALLVPAVADSGRESA
jgi:hypothetical protein